jgi:hypothetical protein
VVFVEDCLIDGNFGGAAIGISDERIGGGKLLVSNTTIRNTGSIGITINPAGVGQRIDAMLEHMRVENSSFGSTFGNNVRVMIYRSVFSGHSQAGIAAGGSTASTMEVNVSRSVSSNNGIGILNLGGTVTIRLSDNDIAFNGTALSGVTQSFSTIRFWGTPC